jgi:hypothetical protein
MHFIRSKVKLLSSLRSGCQRFRDIGPFIISLKVVGERCREVSEEEKKEGSEDDGLETVANELKV